MTRLAYLVAGAAFLTMVAAPATAKSNHRHHGYGNYHQIS